MTIKPDRRFAAWLAGLVVALGTSPALAHDNTLQVIEAHNLERKVAAASFATHWHGEKVRLDYKVCNQHKAELRFWWDGPNFGSSEEGVPTSSCLTLDVVTDSITKLDKARFHAEQNGLNPFRADWEAPAYTPIAKQPRKQASFWARLLAPLIQATQSAEDGRRVVEMQQLNVSADRNADNHVTVNIRAEGPEGTTVLLGLDKATKEVLEKHIDGANTKSPFKTSEILEGGKVTLKGIVKANRNVLIKDYYLVLTTGTRDGLDTIFIRYRADELKGGQARFPVMLLWKKHVITASMELPTMRTE